MILNLILMAFIQVSAQKGDLPPAKASVQNRTYFHLKALDSLNAFIVGKPSELLNTTKFIFPMPLTNYTGLIFSTTSSVW